MVRLPIRVSALLALAPLLLPLGTTSAGTEPGAAYCFGVGCPCGNDDPGGGCINSSGAGGRLTASGSASVAADDCVFSGTQLSTNNVCLLLAGSQQVDLPFFSGKRCVGGALWRMDQHLNSGHGGAVVFSGIVARMATSGLTIQPGDSWNWQIWFRDAPANQTPCGFVSNLTNAYSITYLP